ncbi:hypothetical protein SAMN04487891_102414 [Flagellimonas taeanensis]|uniref:Uncharacterized protein n=1 Tax=Flagellimonas taeanensis TaxID=1005926 RepID=A0A1M6SDQ2_9FLAO|nr:carboxypeptidase-like regulatory domain-containing protein [Allomuricauda taeanensis]SFB80189.1 hypothetical protein SAMN04487891_102414 [Allomuricauda taeanensis]SHK42840.1 hypothetical protein SAMN05216293_1093 [Allomuricauda taeanensis]
MEIRNLKKAQMQDVRFYLILGLGMLLFVNCSAQRNISGTFKRIDPTISGKGLGVEYKFAADGGFEQITNQHLGAREYARGRYTIKSDTLTLRYVPYHKDSTNIAIERTKIQSPPIFREDVSSFIAKVKVIGEEGQPLKGANLLLRDSDNQPLMAFVSDDKGNFPSLNIQNRLFHKIIISSLGHQEVEILTEPYFGHASSIEVRMKSTDTIFKEDDKVIHYLLTKMDQDNIQMIKLPNGEDIVLKKV